ncbi:putative reverse transcriptase zinc-binding domain-containing protein [Rosa chinensis]|uniref:Putative reverse transcriptase zinc-binding domain-containing protein n=1 Tax=Rosa chinensis TaxID=74649 RepID=A0A2P6QUL5_ROSCH|nr:putative reverse transcriptase zinc-binding domain-containing protein [Rosa chinensis]
MYWQPEARGMFTVKTAYWIARECVLSDALTATSNGDPFKPLWKKLWNSKILGKVQIYMWCACHDLLPTRDRLLLKVMMVILVV